MRVRLTITRSIRSRAQKKPPKESSVGPFAVYESSASQGALVGRVELRANFPQRSSGQLALVQLARPLPLTKARLDALLKMTGTAMGPAMPHRPDASAYVTYSFKSAQLRVSYQDLTYTVVTGFAVDTFAQP